MFWNKKYKDFVDLSIGRVYFKPVTHGLDNKIRTKSTYFSNTMNNNLFFQLYEYKLVALSRRKINNLPYEDGLKLRLKLKDILMRYGIINKPPVKEKKEANIFSNNETNWFQKQEIEQLNKFKNGQSASRTD